MTEIRVEPNDHLPDILSKLRNAADQNVTLIVPVDAPVLLTASEFRAVAALVEASNLHLIIDTVDPLRRQLAAMFGLPLSETTTINSITTDAVVEGEEPLQSSNGGDGINEESVDAEDAGDANAGRRFPRRLFIAMLVAGLLLASGWWLLSRYLIKAQVDLQLVRQPVSTDITVSLDGSGATSLVTDEPMSFDLTTKLTKPATGSGTIGDGIAAGEIVLRNTGAAPIEMPEGTDFASFEGVGYATAAGITVPAFQDGIPGEATVDVVAVSPGSTGNQDAGLLTGRMENGVYFSNRNAAVAGGTDKQVTVVSDDDLERLRTASLESLTSRASSEQINGKIIVPDSLVAGAGEFVFDHGSGDEADKVAVTATVHFEATAFAPAFLQSAAEQALALVTPQGSTVETESIAFSQPQVSNGAVTISVEADAIPVVDQEWLDTVASDLAGLSASEAGDYLSAREEVHEFEIAYDPGLLRDGMPSSAARITVTTT